MKNLQVLKEIWENQKRFNEIVMGKKFSQLSTAERQKWTKELILHLHSETDELLREIAWKIHRKEKAPIVLSNLQEELIDVFKYWLSIALVWDMSPEEWLEEYYRKSAVVEQKWHQEQELFQENDRRVVAVDIDQVLFGYLDSFLDFVQEKTSIDMAQYRQPETFDVYGLLAEKFGFGKIQTLKDEYRQSGQKRKGYLLNGAKRFLDLLRAEKFTIILLTARPYKQYRRLYADTLEWLKRYELPFDGIIWDERKNLVVYQEFPDLAFMVEDNLDTAKEVAKLGCKVYLLDKSYNQSPEIPNILRVESLEEILSREHLNE